ncbi:MAG TPA: thiol:disulfide interchange protein DsbA/DsbL [Rhodocyclaceae bacterium]|nr:thiol:disulfide interchange protein DsbA/DsbL [Rhodocyclaceae bacterium]
MRLLKTLLFSVSLAIVGAAALPAFAADPVEGKDYAVINPPQPTDTAGKIEVTEFFWYGCPHCFHFEPTFNQWMKKQAKDVAVRFVPAPLNPTWVPGAKLYFALDAMNLEGKLRNDIFAAIHNERQFNPADDRAFAPWLAKKGVDTAKFNDAYNSFAIQSKLQRAGQQAQRAGIDGTPGVTINGRYRILEPAGMSPEHFMEVADALIAKARKESKK